MFTGLIQAVGSLALRETGYAVVSYPAAAWEDPFQLGESVSVSGCCLTVVGDRDSKLFFNLSEETIAKTTLGVLAVGAPLNLERAVRPTDRMGGHIVQGHVDGLGAVLGIKPEGESRVFRFEVPSGYDRYLIGKGSVAVDGISLTTVNPSAGAFSSHVVPHTLEHTNLSSLKEGDSVNLEFDLLAKYIEKMLPY